MPTLRPHNLEILIKSQPSRVQHLGCQAAVRKQPAWPIRDRHINGEFPASMAAASLTLEVPSAREAANWQSPAYNERLIACN